MGTTKFVAVVASLQGNDSDPSPTTGPTYSTQWLAGCGEYVKEYWSNMSGGREQITWAVHAPVRLPLARAQVPDASGTVQAVRDAAQRDGVPFAADEHLVVFKDWVDTGTGVTGTDPTVVAFNLTVNIILHEMGHFLIARNKQATGHAGVFTNNINLDYSDPSCIMGGAGWTVTATAAFPGGPAFTDPQHSKKNAGTYVQAGPGMSPPLATRAGWLEPVSSAAVTDVSKSLPATVELAPWAGSPAPNYQGLPVAVVAHNLAPGGDPVYISLRSPLSPWDQGFKPPAGHPTGTARLFAQESAPKGAVYRLADCAAVEKSWMRLGRAPLRVEALHGSGPRQASIRVSLDPWRGWTSLDSPPLDWASQLAAVTRGGTTDLFLIGSSGAVYTSRYSGGLWYQWAALTGRTFSPDAGMAVTSTSPDTMDLFVQDEGSVYIRHYTDGDSWEPAWRLLPWAQGELDERSRLAATATGPDRIELFASDRDGVVQHATLNHAGAVEAAEGLPRLPRARALAAESLDGEDLQVHAITEGPFDGRLMSIEGRGRAWPPGWQVNQLPPDATPGLDAGVAAVRVRPGSADALVAARSPVLRFYESGAWQPATERVDGVTATKLSTVAVVDRPSDMLLAFVVGEKRDDSGVARPSIFTATRSFDPEAEIADTQVVRQYTGSLVTLDGRMVTVSDDDAVFAPKTLMTTTGQEFIGPRERFTVLEIKDYNDGWGLKTITAFQAHNGLFVSAVNGGGGLLMATSSQRGPWETFITGPLASPQQSSWIQTTSGKKWSVEPGGGEYLTADRDKVGEWETFFLVGKPPTI
jgi:hypothetical protein